MKLNKLEKSWILYDVGNSAFTLLIATILPIYFNGLAADAGLSEVDYAAYWGYSASIVTIIVAILGPILGTMADTKGYKKPIFIGFLLTGLIGCLALGFAKHWLAFLIVFIIAKVGYSSSLIFYDSMLPDITTNDRVDTVSSKGYAMGYIGSCLPFIACLVIVLGADKLGLSTMTAMMIAFVITLGWWGALSVPLLKNYKQVYCIEKPKHVVKETFGRLFHTLKNIKKEKHIFLFLLAFFFYIDGVYTIIDMAIVYGTALGLNTTGLLLALLVTQIVAFPFAILFGGLARRFGVAKLITLFIGCYFFIAVYAVFLTTQLQFWILAVCVGMFQGGIQALSRSYFTKIIPAEQSGEFFGIYDIFGKGAAFMGTTIVSGVSQLTGKVNLGVGTLAIIFLIGFILFQIANRIKPEELK